MMRRRCNLAKLGELASVVLRKPLWKPQVCCCATCGTSNEWHFGGSYSSPILSRLGKWRLWLVLGRVAAVSYRKWLRWAALLGRVIEMSVHFLHFFILLMTSRKN